MAARNSTGAIEPEVRLEVLLRILPRASCLELMIIFDIAKPTVYKIFHGTANVLLSPLNMGTYPTREEQRNDRSAGFKSSKSLEM